MGVRMVLLTALCALAYIIFVHAFNIAKLKHDEYDELKKFAVRNLIGSCIVFAILVVMFVMHLQGATIH